MTSCLGEKRSSSVYLLAPHGLPGLSSCDAEICAQSQTGFCGDDLDHSKPTEWLNDLVMDHVDGRSCRVGNSKTCEKPLHAGDIAAVERTLQVSSCALIVGLLYAERLQAAENSSSSSLNAGESCVGDDSRDHGVAPSHDASVGCTEGDAVDDDRNFNFSPADLFLLCVLTANKYLYDEGEADACLNGDMAFAGRRKTRRMNQLERVFLRKIDWNLYVSHEEFTSFLTRVERLLATRAIRARGWNLLYQDVDRLWYVLMSQCRIVMSVVFQVFGVMLACYAVLALTIFLQPVILTMLPKAPTTNVSCTDLYSSQNSSVPVHHPSVWQQQQSTQVNSTQVSDAATWMSPFAQSTLAPCHSCALHLRSTTHPVAPLLRSVFGSNQLLLPAANRTAPQSLPLPHVLNLRS